MDSQISPMPSRQFCPKFTIALIIVAVRARRVQIARVVGEQVNATSTETQPYFTSGFDYCVSVYEGAWGKNLLGDACIDGFRNAVVKYIFFANKDPNRLPGEHELQKYGDAAFAYVQNAFNEKVMQHPSRWSKRHLCIVGSEFADPTEKYGINFNTALSMFFYTTEKIITLNGHATGTLKMYQKLNEFLFQPFNQRHTIATQSTCEYVAAMIVGQKELPDPVVTTDFPMQRYLGYQRGYIKLAFRGESSAHFHCGGEGSGVMFPGFLSSASSLGTPLKHCAGGFVIIEIDPGYTRGRDVAIVSFYPREDEVLFPAGTNFKCMAPTLTARKFHHQYAHLFKHANIPWAQIQDKCGDRVTWVKEDMHNASALIKLFKAYNADVVRSFRENQPYGGVKRMFFSNEEFRLESAYPCRLCEPGSDAVCERCRR